MRMLIPVVFHLATSIGAAQHDVLLRDEGMSKLTFMRSDKVVAWQVEVPVGRDLQLIGQSRVLLGIGGGYEERELSTGKKVREVTEWPGTIAARRMNNHHTVLIGVNWQNKEGIVLVELNERDELVKTTVFPGFTYARLFRITEQETFLVTADKVVFEGDRDGKIIWRAEVEGHKSPHAWQAVRLASGETVVSTGYPSNLQFFSKDGTLTRTIGGPPEVNPHFFAGFQVLANGNFVVTNWQGHGPAFGDKGTQLLEYNSKGELVWSWKQDPNKFSSLQGVIVLDGLDLNKLHTENAAGVLTPR